MINKIDSKQNSKIKEIIKLRKLSYQKGKGLFIVEGFHLLDMALKNNALHSVYTLKKIDNIPEDIPQYIINEEILEKISSYKNSQGVVSIAKIKQSRDNISSNRLLYLDDIQDPGNLGTILRTALAFSYSDILLSKNCCNIYNEKVIQSSQGAIFDLNIINADINTLKELKERGYDVIATSLQSATFLDDIKITNPYVLILGNEAHGVNEEIINISNINVKIPIENIDSLNVAIAGAIIMYEFSKNVIDINKS